MAKFAFPTLLSALAFALCGSAAMAEGSGVELVRKHCGPYWDPAWDSYDQREHRSVAVGTGAWPYSAFYIGPADGGGTTVVTRYWRGGTACNHWLYLPLPYADLKVLGPPYANWDASVSPPPLFPDERSALEETEARCNRMKRSEVESEYANYGARYSSEGGGPVELEGLVLPCDHIARNASAVIDLRAGGRTLRVAQIGRKTLVNEIK